MQEEKSPTAFIHSLVSFGSYLFLVSIVIFIGFIYTLDPLTLLLCILYTSDPSPAPPPLQPTSLLCQKQGVSSLGTVWRPLFYSSGKLLPSRFSALRSLSALCLTQGTMTLLTLNN